MKAYTSVRIKIHFQRGKEFARLLHLARPFNELAHPDDALVIRFGNLASILVLPVCGNALLGNSVHLLRTDLHLEWLAFVNHGGVQRLIQVRPRHRDIVLEPAGHGAPNLMHKAERAVTVSDCVSNHAHSEQIVDLVQSALLALRLVVNGIEPLDAGFHVGRHAALYQFLANRVLRFM